MIYCWGSICHGYMCILQYMKLIGCNSFAWIYAWLLGGSVCHWCMCILLYLELIGCKRLACSIWSIGWSLCHGYMCILQYMRLMGCNSVPWIYGHLWRGLSAMSICAFCYMWDLWGVMVQHGSFVIRVVHLTCWYVNSAICETYWV